MSTLSMQQNVLYALGEGASVAETTSLTYSLRWLNASYKNLFLRYRFKSLRTRTLFRTTDGQNTYQAPSDFSGFLLLKDESNENIIGQVTPEEFTRGIDTTKVTDEVFESSDDTAVSLANSGIVQYSETVADDADHTTVYTRDTDYSMNYASGTITTDSTGSITDATDTYIDYLHYNEDKPSEFCIEFDATNGRYVFRLRPTPDAEYVFSLLYPAFPSDLSSSQNPIWSQLEYCIERGGIYYGSLELRQPSDPSIDRFKRDYEEAIQSLIQVDQEMIPKHDRIKIVMRSVDY